SETAGPFSKTACKPCLPRVTAASDIMGHRVVNMATGAQSRLVVCSAVAGHTAGRRTTPSGTPPVVTSCQSATSSLRARACPCAGRGSWSCGWYRGDRLSACGTPGRRGRLLRQCAVLLEHQEAPRQLDHAAAHPGVAGPLFSP